MSKKLPLILRIFLAYFLFVWALAIYFGLIGLTLIIKGLLG